MSWPPRRASHPRDLGAPAVADVVRIDRRGAATDTALSCNFVLHSQVRDPVLLWQLVAKAAIDADASRATVHAHTFLFEQLDPGLLPKSAAVKLVAQAIALRVLSDDADTLGLVLKEWLDLAKVVGHGMHRLFVHGCEGWNENIDSTRPSSSPTPSARRDSWSPFESYDRSTGFSNCFGDSEAHRLRSRVACTCPVTQGEWTAALEAHQKMLTLEARHALFEPSSDDCRLDASEIGGLFLLTHVADFLGKRTDVFDGCFWLLRTVHFGIERNVVFKMTEFRLAQPRSERERRRTSSPNPLRSHCWLTNALDTLVALKVLIFYKLRIHAFDRLEGKAALTTDAEFATTVHVSRHDLEESKSHWLPSRRIAKTRRVKRQRRAPVAADRRVVPLREAFAKMSEERFKLRRRLQTLDRARGIVHALERRRSSERSAMEEEAIAQIAALDTQDERLRLLIDSFSMDKLPELVEERVRRSVLAEGILTLSKDSIWAHTELDAVVALAALETPRLEDLVVRITHSEWASFSNTTVGSNAFEESTSLVARLLALSLCERDYRHVASLDATVRLPIECMDGVALRLDTLDTLPDTASPPAHVSRYEALQNEETLRRGMMATFVRTTSNAMGHAIATCFETCVAVLDGTSSPPTALEMPARLFASHREVAIGVVHRFLAVAAHFRGLTVLVDETVEVHDGTPILVYDVIHRCLRMPVATSVVTRHWAAARHLLALAVDVEQWTRDPRRRPTTLLLPPDQCFVTWSTEGPMYHPNNRDANTKLVEEAEQTLSDAYWPRWPPTEHDVVGDGCLKTALRFGRFTACDALARLHDCRSSVKKSPYT